MWQEMKNGWNYHKIQNPIYAYDISTLWHLHDINYFRVPLYWGKNGKRHFYCQNHWKKSLRRNLSPSIFRIMHCWWSIQLQHRFLRSVAYLKLVNQFRRMKYCGPQVPNMSKIVQCAANKCWITHRTWDMTIYVLVQNSMGHSMHT